MELFGFVWGFFNLHVFCFLTPEPPSALMLSGVAEQGAAAGPLGGHGGTGPGQRPAAWGICGRVPGPRAARPAARVLTLRFH